MPRFQLCMLVAGTSRLLSTIACHLPTPPLPSRRQWPMILLLMCCWGLRTSECVMLTHACCGMSCAPVLLHCRAGMRAL